MSQEFSDDDYTAVQRHSDDPFDQPATASHEWTVDGKLFRVRPDPTRHPEPVLEGSGFHQTFPSGDALVLARELLRVAAERHADTAMLRGLLPILGLRLREIPVEELSPETFADTPGQAAIFPLESLGVGLRLAVEQRVKQLVERIKTLEANRRTVLGVDVPKLSREDLFLLKETVDQFAALESGLSVEQIHQHLAAHSLELAAAEARGAEAEREKILRSGAWPLLNVLKRLCDGVDHLLGHHACDCHGYEELCAARDSGRELSATLEE